VRFKTDVYVIVMLQFVRSQ